MKKGISSETLAKKWLLRNNWSIQASRIEIAHVEVDILARDPSGLLHIVEVKSEGALNRGILSERQKSRLARVAMVISQKEPVFLVALVVKSNGSVLKVPVY